MKLVKHKTIKLFTEASADILQLMSISAICTKPKLEHTLHGYIISHAVKHT